MNSPLNSRERTLASVRAILGRAPGQKPSEPPPVRLKIPEVPLDVRIASFAAALEKLNGKALHAQSQAEARAYAEKLIAGGSAVASNAPFLAECGIASLAGVRTGFTSKDELKTACAAADLGITSADYALADTGSLVMISSHQEARLVSLLPPVHLAVVPCSRLLTGLDELFAMLPEPAARSSSIVFITGPSRTADIEQILVRGVHGPGAVHVVLI
jgi:L-lactate utilization protein LutC